MTGILYRDPVRAIIEGAFSPGAALEVLDEADELAALYADPDLRTRLANPLQADGAGYFPPIYVETGVTYDIEVTDAAGNVLFSQADLAVDILPLAVFDVADPKDLNGDVMPGAARTFYKEQTTELATVWADEAQLVELDNPVEADEDGVFPDTYLDPDVAYRVQLHSGPGNPAFPPAGSSRSERLLWPAVAGILQYDIGRTALYPGSVPPTAPVLSGALNGSEDAIDLEWTASVSLFSTIAGYRLYNADTDELIVDQAGLTYEFSPIAEGNTYSFYVIGYDANGLDSPPSNIVSIGLAVTVEIITSSRTWVKPVGLLSLVYELIGAGGGGGSGANKTNGSVTGGGEGGGGGEYRTGTILDAALGTTEDVVIGIGGAGGPPVTGGNQVGLHGSIGTLSSFGAHAVANPGEGGRGGETSATGLGQGGTGGSGGTGENGGDGGEPKLAGTADPGASTTNSGPGGGGGGGRTTSAFTGANGGDGGSSSVSIGGDGGLTGTEVAGATNGADGEDDAAGEAGGGGGGGGCGVRGNSPATPRKGGDGGAGGTYGAGGGGGGASSNSNLGVAGTSGTGGDGAGGVLKLTYTYVP